MQGCQKNVKLSGNPAANMTETFSVGIVRLFCSFVIENLLKHKNQLHFEEAGSFLRIHNLFSVHQLTMLNRFQVALYFLLNPFTNALNQNAFSPILLIVWLVEYLF